MQPRIDTSDLQPHHPSFDEQYEEAKQALHEYVERLFDHDPERAVNLAHKFTQRSFTRHEASLLLREGIPLDPILIETGLPGGMMEGAGEVLSLLRGAVELIVNGNEAEVRARLGDPLVPARIQLPNGNWIDGQHEGKRALNRPQRTCASCFLKRYEMLACGEGKFHSDQVKYEGDFYNNLFHDHTGKAVYYINQDTRYTGSFAHGKREGSGTLEKYDTASHNFYTYFKGVWKEDQPYSGVYTTPDGQVINHLDEGLLRPTTGTVQAPPSQIAGVHERDVAIEMQQPIEQAQLESNSQQKTTQDKQPTEQELVQKRGLQASETQKVETTTKLNPLPNIAFGKADWEKYFGPIGEEPPLPPDIERTLQSPCPIWPDKSVQETHLLTLIPTAVNGKPLTLDNLLELMKCPQVGVRPLNYSSYHDLVKSVLGSQSPHKATWVLMTKDVIPGSRSQTYRAQLDLIKDISSRSGLPYELPGALDAAVSILMHYVKSGERLYTDSPWTYTRCHERLNHERWPVSIGGCTADGLHVCILDFDNDVNGVGGVRKF